MVAVTYLIAICLIAVCVASSFVSLTAYEVCRRKALAYLGIFALAYGIEQAFILYNEYITQNLPFNAEWGAMEDPLSHIALGVAICQPFWLIALDFANEQRPRMKYGPIVAFIVASIFFFAIPNMGDAVRKWILYTLRQFFLLGVSLYFWLRYLSVNSEVEKTRYSRKAPVVAVFTLLVVLVILEDAAVMLLMEKPNLDDVFLTEFLYRRNVIEILLGLCVIGYAAHDSICALRLKRESAPAPAEEPQQRQMHEAIPYFARRYNLSPREEEILTYMLEGFDNQRIASKLQVSIGTVKTHTHHIFVKAGVSNRPELFQKFWAEA